MAQIRQSIHGQWSSRWVFILAATGSAVGLGNIWRFPYVTGENGGAAFVLVYLACVAAIGLPVMMAEILLGRRGRRSPINSIAAVAEEEGLRASWAGIGWLGVVAGFLILSFYSVIAGISLAYVFYTAFGAFAAATAEIANARYDAITGSWLELLLWHSAFMSMTVGVVARGVSGGLEMAVTRLMPMLFVLLVLMCGYALATGDLARTYDYLIKPDFSALSPAAVVDAMGQAFFSLSLGMGAIMIYGSYLPDDTRIPQVALIVAAADTLVAVLAGLAIFPIVFAYNLEPGSGPGLVFKTLTVAFGGMPGGQLFGTVFFLLLTVAAWTSAISLLEPAVTWLVEAQDWSRRFASWSAGGAAWLLGIGALLSFNAWETFTPGGRTFFDWSEFISTAIMLPLGGLLIAVFAGWRVSEVSTIEELGGPSLAYRIWQFLVRYVAPVGVVLVFLNGIGVFAALRAG